MNQLHQTLASIIELVTPQLRQLDESTVKQKPDPNRWAKIEILGHLIDSACNNHRRFVMAQSTDELIFDGYDQESWVRLQNYLDGNWQRIVEFWASYNHLIANLISQIADDVLTRPRVNHRLHRIAWKPIPEHDSATLEYFIKDYIGHLEHHVRQILPDYQPIVMGTYEYSSV